MIIMSRFICIILLCLGSCTLAWAQPTKEEIQKKQQELQRELAELNKTLAEIKNNKKTSLAELAVVQRKIKAREELINNISRELRRLDDEIYLTQLEMNRLRRELDTLKQQYAKSLVFAYKNRSNYDYLNFLFSAQSFNDAVKRVAYLKSYRQYRETQAATIAQTQQLLTQKNQSLANSKRDKSKTLNEQNNQLNVLEQDRNEQKKVVEQLQGREKEIAKQVAEREKQRQKLRQALAAIIRREEEEARKAERQRLAKLAEDERRRKEAEKNKPSTATAGNTKPVTSSNPPLNNPPIETGSRPKSDRTYNVFESTPEGLTLSLNFESNRGKLPWPVSEGVVTGNFGVQKVSAGVDRKNYGLLITCKNSIGVRCVADGIVANIIELGSYQCVVVRHGKYFSVYSQVDGVKVSKGQEVKAGTLLANVAEVADDEFELEFQVMNNGNSRYENPSLWLKPR